MKSKFNDKAAIDMAYFRFSLIAPVIQATFTDPTKTAYYRRVTKNSFTLPNGKVMVYNPKTLEKWEEYYRIKGYGWFNAQRTLGFRTAKSIGRKCYQ